MFYLKWVDPTETVFNAGTHAHVDEDVFSFQLTHAEGEFPALEIDVINPKIGLLAPSRKQWVWLSYKRPSDNVIDPLFFGRLVGVPKDMEGTTVRLSFVARPLDYVEQKAAAADDLRALPYYDPAWVAEVDRADPDIVLDGYPRLWHIDRVTGQVTSSDITTGEDGLFDFSGDDAPFYDSLSVSYSQSPARRCIVTGSVKWAQSGAGGIDISRKLYDAFASGTATASITNIKGDPVDRDGMLCLVAGDEMVANWPKPGDSVGGGWAVGVSSATLIGPPPLPPIIIGGDSSYQIVHSWDTWPLLSSAMRTALQIVFERAPGFVVQVIDHNKITAPNLLGHIGIEILWIPVWRVAVHMEMTWDVSRARTETLSFAVDADVQPLLTDPGSEEVIEINIGPADVDGYIGAATRARYFDTDRGRQTTENLILRARAALLARARAIDVSFEVPFETAASLSCRMSGVIVTDRIPGGSAGGKVKAYSLTADGDSKQIIGSVTLGCTVGRDGHVDVDPGTPDYVSTGYVSDGYQSFTGSIVVPGDTEDIGYTLESGYDIDDDGVELTSIHVDDFLDHIEYTGTLDTHQAQINILTGYPAGAVETIDRADDFATKVEVFMKAISQRAFDSTVVPTLTTLKVPRTIDLESEGTT